MSSEALVMDCEEERPTRATRQKAAGKASKGPPKGKAAGKAKGTKEAKERRSMTQRAGILFPVARVRRHLRHGCPGTDSALKGTHSQVRPGAGVYLAATLEYLVAEVLELAGNAAKDDRKRRINNRHILLALHNDTELCELVRSAVIPCAGVVPHVHPALLPKAHGKTPTKE